LISNHPNNSKIGAILESRRLWFWTQGYRRSDGGDPRRRSICVGGSAFSTARVPGDR
jgi:hypothetical protein